jgi:hypothetical protein
MATQVQRNAKAFSFLLTGAAMLLVMSVISFCVTNMTNKLQFGFWFELAAGA